MKKYLLLLTVCVLFVTVNGQVINKDFFYGQWKAYAVIAKDFSFNTDSATASKTIMINSAIALSPDKLISREDSLGIISQCNITEKLIDSSSLNVTNDGKYKASTFFSAEKNKIKTGSFKWLSDNEIGFKHGVSVERLRIKSLTAKHLIIVGNEENPEEKFEVRYKK